MAKDLLIGLGLGLILYPVADYLRQIPFVGRYVVLLFVIVGIVFLVKGYMHK